MTKYQDGTARLRGLRCSPATLSKSNRGQAFNATTSIGRLTLNVRLCDALEAKGIHSKAWMTSKGRAMGGAVFSRSALYYLLQNRQYLGEIVQKAICHPGQHPAIVDTALFEKVQAHLEANRGRHHADRAAKAERRPSHARLTGKLFDAEGDVMSPTIARGKADKTYRYYVSSCLQLGVAAANAPRRRDRRCVVRPKRKTPSHPPAVGVFEWVARSNFAWTDSWLASPGSSMQRKIVRAAPSTR